MAGGARASAERLVARARRPALDPWARPPVFDTVEEIRQIAAPAGFAHDDQRPAPPSGSWEPVPVREAGTLAELAASTQAGSPAAAQASARLETKPERPVTRTRRAAVVEEQSRLPAREVDRSQAAAVEPAGPSPVVRGARAADPVQAFAEPVQAVADPSGETPAALRGARPPAPAVLRDAPTAMPGIAVPRPTDGGPAAAARPGSSPPEPAPVPTAFGPSVGSQPARGPAASPPAPEVAAVQSAPSVVIDEIRIVTPPASLQPADPLAALAARRVGASRHRGGARWPA